MVPVALFAQAASAPYPAMALVPCHAVVQAGRPVIFVFLSRQRWAMEPALLCIVQSCLPGVAVLGW